MSQGFVNALPVPLPIAKGGTNSTSVVSAPAASAWAGWDANSNLSGNNLLAGYATTVTAAATTTLTVSSVRQQYFTGTTTQTVVMPVTSTLALGQSWMFVNNSSGVVTIQSSGGNTIQAMAANSYATITCTLLTGTTASSWNASYSLSGGASGTVNSGLINQLAYYAAAGTTLSGLSITNSAVLTTNGSGVPSWVAYTGTGSPVLGTSPTITTPNIVGVTNASSASAGSLGEIISSTILQASAATMTSNTFSDVTSITLTAGQWYVWGNISFATLGTTPNQIQGWINTTSATQPNMAFWSAIVIVGLGNGSGVTVPPRSFNVNTNTVVYLSGFLGNASGNGTACGNLFALRVR